MAELQCTMWLDSIWIVLIYILIQKRPDYQNHRSNVIIFHPKRKLQLYTELYDYEVKCYRKWSIWGPSYPIILSIIQLCTNRRAKGEEQNLALSYKNLIAESTFCSGKSTYFSSYRKKINVGSLIMT